MFSARKLYEEIENLYGKIHIDKLEIPTYITENLSKELREYQEEAFRYYLANFKTLKRRHLMFNMATGSGKTLMMAALILDCFKRGYRDFIFFVDKSTIVEKTKANFSDISSPKYLFAPSILIDSKPVSINVIENLNESKEDCINICFTTIQALYTTLTTLRENAFTLGDFEGKKVVLLADEAHHLNAHTKSKGKGKLSKEEKENIEGWEKMVERIFKSDNENLLLEFTATIPEDLDVQEKYRDKLIAEYHLKRFYEDGYAKVIDVLKYENKDIKQRFLGAVLLNLFRELVALKHGIFLKPVVLFKSEGIPSSKDREKEFLEFIDELNHFSITEFYSGIQEGKGSNKMLLKSFWFFKEYFGEGYAHKIVERLKAAFSKQCILNANDDKEVEKYQILLNTLEDSSNPIRAIFAVNKLSEGWDVLNLFDIVRLRTEAKEKQVATTQEVQLIGRGARYYPFLCEGDSAALEYKRKFDRDMDNELSVLERMTYHSLNDSKFIQDLYADMYKQGLLFEVGEDGSSRGLKEVVLEPNKEILAKKPKNITICYAKNERSKNKRREPNDLFNLGYEIINKIDDLCIPLFSKNVKEDTDVLAEQEKKDKLLEEELTPPMELDFIENSLFLKAMNQCRLSFKDIVKYYEVASKEEFINNVLKRREVRFHKKQDFTKIAYRLDMAKYVVENFKNYKEEILSKPYVTPFVVKKLNMDKRSILTTKNIDPKEYKWLLYSQVKTLTDVEDEFLKFIDRKKQEIDKFCFFWFIVRNDDFSDLKIYDNRDGSATYGVGFEPDFIFFGIPRDKKNKGQSFNIECFIEGKGEHLIGKDGWKEEFLKSLQNQTLTFSKKDAKETQDGDVEIYGLPFFRIQNSNNMDFKETFDEFFKIFKYGKLKY